jgi:flagellar basal-body rod protein FlgC
MFDSLDISSSALLAQRTRLDSIAQNIANANSTRNAAGERVPPARKFVVFQAVSRGKGVPPGVRATVKEDTTQRLVEDWGHGDRDANGIVRYPNIDLPVEYVNALEASRAYEANVTAMEVTKAMINASMRLLA